MVVLLSNGEIIMIREYNLFTHANTLEANNLNFANDIDGTSKQQILEDFAEKIENQQSVPNEFLEVVNNNFWELLENQDGKTLGQLERGMFNNIELVGNIINKSDRVKYLIDGRL